MDRERKAAARAAETPSQRKIRLEKDRRVYFKNEVSRQKKLAKMREAWAKKRLSNKLPENYRARKIRLQKDRRRKRLMYFKNEGARQKKLARMKERAKIRLSNELPEDKRKRLEAVRKAAKFREMHETADERHERQCWIKIARDHRIASRWTMPSSLAHLYKPRAPTVMYSKPIEHEL